MPLPNANNFITFSFGFSCFKTLNKAVANINFFSISLSNLSIKEDLKLAVKISL